MRPWIRDVEKNRHEKEDEDGDEVCKPVTHIFGSVRCSKLEEISDVDPPVVKKHDR